MEFALVLPLLLTVVLGGLMLGLATIDRQQRTFEAQQAAWAAAGAGAEDSACLAALEALRAISARPYAACDGTDGLSMDYDPPAVRITIDGGSYPVPFMDAVAVSGSAAAMLREETP